MTIAGACRPPTRDYAGGSHAAGGLLSTLLAPVFVRVGTLAWGVWGMRFRTGTTAVSIVPSRPGATFICGAMPGLVAIM